MIITKNKLTKDEPLKIFFIDLDKYFCFDCLDRYLCLFFSFKRQRSMLWKKNLKAAKI